MSDVSVRSRVMSGPLHLNTTSCSNCARPTVKTGSTDVEPARAQQYEPDARGVVDAQRRQVRAQRRLGLLDDGTLLVGAGLALRVEAEGGLSAREAAQQALVPPLGHPASL